MTNTPSITLLNCLSPACWYVSGLLHRAWAALAAERPLRRVFVKRPLRGALPTDFIGNADIFYRLVQTHDPYSIIADQATRNQALDTQFTHYGSLLKKGFSLFALTAGEDYAPLRDLVRGIIAHSGLKQVPVRFIQVYGNPDLLVEQRCRYEMNARGVLENFARHMASDLLTPVLFLEQAAHDFGRDQVFFLPDDSRPDPDGTLVTPDAAWLHALLLALGRDMATDGILEALTPSSPSSGPVPLPQKDDFFLALRSREARRLWQQCFRGDNIWPRKALFTHATLLDAQRQTAVTLNETERHILASRPDLLHCGPVLSARQRALLNAGLREHLPALRDWMDRNPEAILNIPASQAAGCARSAEDIRAEEPTQTAETPFTSLPQEKARPHTAGEYPAINAEAADRLLEDLDAETLVCLAENGSVEYEKDDEAGHIIAVRAVARLEELQRPCLRRCPPAGVTLSVVTFTCNQQDFLVENIESVLAQNVRVPMEHIIVDDRSTDGTRDIILAYARRYPHIRPVFVNEVLPSICLGVREGFSRVRGTCVALLDGDDYFTDPDKLQMQVDFLDAHPRCGLCFHPALVKYEGENPRTCLYPPADMLPGGLRETYHMALLLHGNPIQTSSVMYRWRFAGGLPPWFDYTLLPGDWYWHFLHAENADIGFINRTMSVYRRHSRAMYISSSGDIAEHRLRFGMGTLRLYATMNRHCGGKYIKPLYRLAADILRTFLDAANNRGDSHLLDKALRDFPEFGERFVHETGYRPSA